MEELAPGGSLQRAESLPFLPNSPKTPAGREQSLKNDECRGLKVKSSPAGSRGAKVPVPAPCCHRRFRFSQLGVTCGAAAAAFGPTGRLCRSPAGAEAEPQHPARCWRQGSASPCFHHLGFAPQGFRILCLSPWQRTSPAVREVWLWVASLRGSARPGSTHGCHPGTSNKGVGVGAIWGAAASFAPPHPW